MWNNMWFLERNPIGEDVKIKVKRQVGYSEGGIRNLEDEFVRNPFTPRLVRFIHTRGTY